MFKITRRTIGLSAIIFLIISGFQNCGKVNFSAAPSALNVSNPNGTLTNNPCTLSNTMTAVNLKIIFMVDDSGSTKQTDPNQSYRITAVQDLISQYGSVSTFRFAYGYFNGSTSKLYDDNVMGFVSSSGATSVFGAVADLSAALTAFEKIAPSDSTPYMAAFSGLLSGISLDQSLGNASAWSYAVVFMSDGQPKDLTGNVQQDIIGLVDQLRGTVAKQGSASTVSSVYFGPESDSGAIANLTTMASEGQGQFIDANKTSPLNFAQVITVAGTSCPAN